MADIIPSRCDLDVGDVINNKYVVERRLGEGSFGIVYRVKSRSDGMLYALKLLKLWTIVGSEREQLRKRFIQEYETGRIKSNYLVQSIEHNQLANNPYIVMEFCAKGDLGTALQNNHLELVQCAHEILLGLKALHINGKVHRDLKPENVLVKDSHHVALTDFGISGDRNKRLTERNILGVPQQMFGTYAYMPPEQVNPARGNATVLPTTDIFSFGVMMFELLTKQLPFGPLEEEAHLYRYIDNGKKGIWNRQLLKAIPQSAEWEKLIGRCLEPNFQKRLQTTDEVIALLPSHHFVSQSAVEISHDIHTINHGLALRIMQGEEYGQVYYLDDLMKTQHRKVLTMGRPDVGITNVINIKELESSYISRKHCTLEFDTYRGQWLLRDGQWDRTVADGWKTSLNGTYLDSQQVDKYGIYILPGNIISIGDVKMRVEGY